MIEVGRDGIDSSSKVEVVRKIKIVDFGESSSDTEFEIEISPQ